MSDEKNLATIIAAWMGRPTGHFGVQGIQELAASVASAKGEVRNENQDRVAVARFVDSKVPTRSFLACVLCDGMGGMVDGARCAQIAIGSFLAHLAYSPYQISDERARSAALRANDEVFEAHKGRGGTTLAAILFGSESIARAVTVGDSRLYGISRARTVQQISVDDTIAGELKRLNGGHDASGLEPFSNRLAQYVGMGEGIEPRTYSLDLSQDSGFMLTSDGIQNIPDTTFTRLLSGTSSLHALASRLLQVSNWCGGEDNASVICVSARAAAVTSSSIGSQFSGSVIEIWDGFSKLDAIVPELSQAKSESRSAWQQWSNKRNVPRSNDFQPMSNSPRTNRRSRPRKTKKSETKNSKIKSGRNFEKIGPPNQLEIQIVETPSKPKTGT